MKFILKTIYASSYSLFERKCSLINQSQEVWECSATTNNHRNDNDNNDDDNYNFI